MRPRSRSLAGDAIRTHAAPMSHGSGLPSWRMMRRGINVVPGRAASSRRRFSICSAPGRAPRCSLAPTMVKRAADYAGRLRRRQHPYHRLGRRAVYVEDALKALGQLRGLAPRSTARARARYAITVLPKDDIADASIALARRLASAGRPPRLHRRQRCGRDAGDRPPPAGETAKYLPRRHRDGGLLAQSRPAPPTLKGGYLHTGDVGAFDAEWLSDH